MKPKSLLIAIVLTIALSTVAQEIKHAPTLESCAADINLWTGELQGYPKVTAEQVRKDLARLTVEELRLRMIYLNDCTHAHPELAMSEPGELSSAVTLGLVDYSSEIRDRLAHFLDRHDLGQKFLDEDAAGKR